MGSWWTEEEEEAEEAAGKTHNAGRPWWRIMVVAGGFLGLPLPLLPSRLPFNPLPHPTFIPPNPLASQIESMSFIHIHHTCPPVSLTRRYKGPITGHNCARKNNKHGQKGHNEV